MADTNEASEHARALIAQRWGPPGTRVLARSVDTVVSRRADLTGEQRAALEAAITEDVSNE
jgi:hypothetical protein